MEIPFSKYIIVGAGLSGLTAAYELHKAGETDFTILESREVIGGRILTKENIDFGATWFQNHHQNVSKLLDELGLEKFHQYNKGQSVLVYSSMAPAHHFENDPNTPSAYRIARGSISMIQQLAKPFINQIKMGTTVSGIREIKNEILVSTNTGMHKATKVIVTIPPRITTRISFSPELPDTLIEAMERTHTWMSNAMKVGMRFKRPFWKDKNYSGMVIGQVGAVTELYDHTDYKNEQYALMGFINEGLRDVSAAERKTRILEYLAKYLGEGVLEYTSYQEKDWAQDPNTSCENIKSIYMSPSYGNPLFKDFYMDGKLFFAGAETSPLYGGYMDGAINSGKFAATKLLKNINSK